MVSERIAIRQAESVVGGTVGVSSNGPCEEVVVAGLRYNQFGLRK